MAEEVQEENIKKKKVMGKSTIILLFLIILLLGGIGTLATMMFLGGGNSSTDSAKIKKTAEKKKPSKPIYYAIKDPLIVNFSDQSKAAIKYIQVTVQVMAYNKKTIDAVKLNLPAIRNDLSLSLLGQKYMTLRAKDGSEKLRKAFLDTVNTTLKKEASIDKGVEAVYLTKFLMQ